MKKLYLVVTVFLTLSLLSGNLPGLIVNAEGKTSDDVNGNVQYVAESEVTVSPVAIEEIAVSEETAAPEEIGMNPSNTESGTAFLSDSNVEERNEEETLHAESTDEPHLHIKDIAFGTPDDHIAYKEGDIACATIIAENSYNGKIKNVFIRTDDLNAIIYDVSVIWKYPIFVIEYHVNGCDVELGKLKRVVNIVCVYEDENGGTFEETVTLSLSSDYPIIKDSSFVVEGMNVRACRSTLARPKTIDRKNIMSDFTGQAILANAAQSSRW